MFNICIQQQSIPIEWKIAVVTPLFKNKGNKNDMNNYRGISVLPVLEKIFEKILASQIVEHLEKNKILFEGQHGFRPDHSCETALYELISDLVKANDKKMISLLLFMVFKKALDLVDSKILLRKLGHLGFDNNSLKQYNIHSYLTCINLHFNSIQLYQ